MSGFPIDQDGNGNHAVAFASARLTGAVGMVMVGATADIGERIPLEVPKGDVDAIDSLDSALLSALGSYRGKPRRSSADGDDRHRSDGEAKRRWRRNRNRARSRRGSKRRSRISRNFDLDNAKEKQAKPMAHYIRQQMMMVPALPVPPMPREDDSIPEVSTSAAPRSEGASRRCNFVHTNPIPRRAERPPIRPLLSTADGAAELAPNQKASNQGDAAAPADTQERSGLRPAGRSKSLRQLIQGRRLEYMAQMKRPSCPLDRALQESFVDHENKPRFIEYFKKRLYHMHVQPAGETLSIFDKAIDEPSAQESYMHVESWFMFDSAQGGSRDCFIEATAHLENGALRERIFKLCGEAFLDHTETYPHDEKAMRSFFDSVNESDSMQPHGALCRHVIEGDEFIERLQGMENLDSVAFGNILAATGHKCTFSDRDLELAGMRTRDTWSHVSHGPAEAISAISAWDPTNVNLPDSIIFSSYAPLGNVAVRKRIFEGGNQVVKGHIALSDLIAAVRLTAFATVHRTLVEASDPMVFQTIAMAYFRALDEKGTDGQFARRFNNFMDYRRPHGSATVYFDKVCKEWKSKVAEFEDFVGKALPSRWRQGEQGLEESSDRQRLLFATFLEPNLAHMAEIGSHCGNSAVAALFGLLNATRVILSGPSRTTAKFDSMRTGRGEERRLQTSELHARIEEGRESYRGSNDERAKASIDIFWQCLKAWCGGTPAV
eukprot:Polyplicarium_translucidae@DN1016_c0_g1_i1.p1